MKHRFLFMVFGAALSLPLAGCLINESSAVEAPLNTLAQGGSSGVISQRFEVIRDAASLAALWREHTAMEEPPPALPQIDFERDMVIAAFLGQRTSGGVALRIGKLSNVGGALTAHLDLTSPGAGCITTQALSQPYHMVVTRRQEHAVGFQVHAITTDCN